MKILYEREVVYCDEVKDGKYPYGCPFLQQLEGLEWQCLADEKQTNYGREFPMTKRPCPIQEKPKDEKNK